MESRTKFYGSILAMLTLTAVSASGIPLPDWRSEPVTWRSITSAWEHWEQHWTRNL